ncbi:MAG: TetR/AcrR family transcriptional regulator [Myxococcota bacterium]
MLKTPDVKASYHHGDLRRALVDASLEILTSRDVADLSLREVARRAGVSPAAPYHHFGGKAELLAAIAVEAYGLLEERMRLAVAGTDEGGATLRDCVRAYVRFALEQPSHFRVMHHAELRNGETHEELAKARQSIWQFLAEVLRGDPVKKDFLIEAGNESTLLCLAWATAHGLATLCLDGYLGSKLSMPFDVAQEPEAVADAVSALLATLVDTALRRG